MVFQHRCAVPCLFQVFKFIVHIFLLTNISRMRKRSTYVWLKKGVGLLLRDSERKKKRRISSYAVSLKTYVNFLCRAYHDLVCTVCIGFFFFHPLCCIKVTSFPGSPLRGDAIKI